MTGSSQMTQVPKETNMAGGQRGPGDPRRLIDQLVEEGHGRKGMAGTKILRQGSAGKGHSKRKGGGAGVALGFCSACSGTLGGFCAGRARGATWVPAGLWEAEGSIQRHIFPLGTSQLPGRLLAWSPAVASGLQSLSRASPL